MDAVYFIEKPLISWMIFWGTIIVGNIHICMLLYYCIYVYIYMYISLYVQYQSHIDYYIIIVFYMKYI